MKRQIVLTSFLVFLSCGAVSAQTYMHPTDEADLRLAAYSFEKTFYELGLKVHVLSCRHLVELGVGTAGGNTSYGAFCTIQTKGKPRTWLLCNDNMAGHFALTTTGAETDEEITKFTRDYCFGG